MEEFLDTDLSLKDSCLHPFFNVKFDVKHISGLGNTETTKVLRATLGDP